MTVFPKNYGIMPAGGENYLYTIYNERSYFFAARISSPSFSSSVAGF